MQQGATQTENDVKAGAADGGAPMQQTARHEGLTVIVGAGFVGISTSKSSIPDPRLHIQLCCTHAKSHRHRHTVPTIVCIFLPVISSLCCSGWKSSWAIGWLVKVASRTVFLCCRTLPHERACNCWQQATGCKQRLSSHNLLLPASSLETLLHSQPLR